MKPPEIPPEPGWREFELPFAIGSGRSMFVETAGGPTIRMGFFERSSDRMLVGKVWFGPASFGPPGFVHGGVSAYVMDEAMGSAAWLGGYACVAANLDLDYLELTPLGELCLIEARVTAFARLRKDKLVAFSRQASHDVPDLSGFEFAG